LLFAIVCFHLVIVQRITPILIELVAYSGRFTAKFIQWYHLCHPFEATKKTWNIIGKIYQDIAMIRFDPVGNLDSHARLLRSLVNFRLVVMSTDQVRNKPVRSEAP